MTEFDNIAEKRIETEWREWRDDVDDELEAIAQLVADRRGGQITNRTGYFAGSFNVCIQFGFKDDGPDAIIRFPKKGPVALRDEKVLAEVCAMKLLQEFTTIPIPRLIGWGLTADSPSNVGPFIIMDFVEGVILTDIMKKSGQVKHILDPGINIEKLKVIYDQISNFTLQIHALDFGRIGTLQEHGDSNYVVGGRPWTYNMNEIATSCGVTVDKFCTESIDSSDDYMNMLAGLHRVHLDAQRNIATDGHDASRRYIARHLFAKLVAGPHRPHKTGPQHETFKLFCDDFRPANMLVNKETLQITAVLDFEFTNVLPRGFAESPPWWLLLVGPDLFLERGFTMSNFIELYEPQLALFLEAMERQEETRPPLQEPLSTKMRKSWESGDFWYFFAARKSLDVDILFYEQINQLYFGGTAGAHLLDPAERADMDQFITMKMKQKEEYDEEYANVASEDESETSDD